MNLRGNGNTKFEKEQKRKKKKKEKKEKKERWKEWEKDIGRERERKSKK